jgi:hypothetical protein
VTIGARRLAGRHVVLTLDLTTAGAVTVSGPGLKRYRGTVSAGVHQIQVALSNRELSLRAVHREIRIEVTLRGGEKTSSATTTLKL